MKKCSNVMITFASALLIVAIIFISKGFYVKNEYYNSENYESLNKNSYVGGDAYNYIINGTYFTGYMVLGSSAGMGAVILLSVSLFFRFKNINNNKENASEVSQSQVQTVSDI